MPYDPKKAGKVLRVARLSKNMTQKNLATAINATDRTISDIERGQRNPTVDLLSAMLDVLELPANAVFQQDEEGDSSELEQLFRAIRKTTGQKRKMILKIIWDILNGMPE